MQKHPIWGNEMTLPCFLRGIFFYHINQNAKKKQKKHGNHPVWDNKTILPKTCLLCVHQLLTYRNTKMHARHSLWRNTKTLPKNVYF